MRRLYKQVRCIDEDDERCDTCMHISSGMSKKLITEFNALDITPNKLRDSIDLVAGLYMEEIRMAC